MHIELITTDRAVRILNIFKPLKITFSDDYHEDSQFDSTLILNGYNNLLKLKNMKNEDIHFKALCDNSV
ncbi:hypothetical protein [Acinetobacter sp. WCHAc010052]|uniref:hypothetical protein n=1 Tax=Acinetobacter sp. WCHAc010052 TaxID=2004647 RepID=UPI000B3C236E|nr:hypothetical protein [Acinetobacter sp. WCHAc010052]AXY59455.1 hypothetical protein CDG61_05075 [Acinetobacter sp. WCHAc010052]